jgi:NADP-dependent 3-hydroxy acid dehydrogenase YdfG
MQLDLNDLDSVKTFAEKFNDQYSKLDILLNNAGIMALQKRETTK